ncbi:N-formylglutamate deformylase [Pedomonas mirosovicensis]|uniref:N-formylglutamate deformylase n=1 Tax=Pedomonas mirosovicensis TaxID=2908641 RepID=UPI0021687C96|nr:N-formylglutamate deformylase [Pedomonas mirosovicensis]MCH8686033.1 N-formylglutamate deformylase [Pedomonas mirosovicensis]
MTPVFDFAQGTLPLLISIPHAGTELPDALRQRLSPPARAVPDTDWHVEKLYAFAAAMGASVLKANYSRYVVDLNRPTDGALLYPGQRETGLCPLITFNDEPLYAPGDEPGAEEVAERVTAYWKPYHDRLAATLEAIKARHGFAVLWDAHSIRSRVPVLFEGRLPDFNLGTGAGTACPAEVAEDLLAVARSADGFSAVLNGRFKGGYITRHYGRPEDNIIAVQLELAQSAYMDEGQPLLWDASRAEAAQQVIERLLRALVERARRWVG